MKEDLRSWEIINLFLSSHYLHIIAPNVYFISILPSLIKNNASVPSFQLTNQSAAESKEGHGKNVCVTSQSVLNLSIKRSPSTDRVLFEHVRESEKVGEHIKNPREHWTAPGG